MYRKPPANQLAFEDFVLPFGGKLNGQNRWVRLAELIPWDEVEAIYAKHFSRTQGAPAKSPLCQDRCRPTDVGFKETLRGDEKRRSCDIPGTQRGGAEEDVAAPQPQYP